MANRDRIGQDEIDYASDWAATQENGGTKYQEHFANWIAAKTEFVGSSKAANEAFRLGALAGIRYRSHEQRSDENLDFHAASKAARETAASERPARKAKAPVEDAPAARPTRKAKAAAPVAETPAPARRTRRTAAAATAEPTAKAPVRRAAATAKPARATRRTGKAAGAEAEF